MRRQPNTYLILIPTWLEVYMWRILPVRYILTPHFYFFFPFWLEVYTWRNLPSSC